MEAVKFAHHHHDDVYDFHSWLSYRHFLRDYQVQLRVAQSWKNVNCSSIIKLDWKNSSWTAVLMIIRRNNCDEVASASVLDQSLTKKMCRTASLFQFSQILCIKKSGEREYFDQVLNVRITLFNSDFFPFSVRMDKLHWCWHQVMVNSSHVNFFWKLVQFSIYRITMVQRLWCAPPSMDTLKW